MISRESQVQGSSSTLEYINRSGKKGGKKIPFKLWADESLTKGVSFVGF